MRTEPSAYSSFQKQNFCNKIKNYAEAVLYSCPILLDFFTFFQDPSQVLNAIMKSGSCLKVPHLTVFLLTLFLMFDSSQKVSLESFQLWLLVILDRTIFLSKGRGTFRNWNQSLFKCRVDIIFWNLARC